MAAVDKEFNLIGSRIFAEFREDVSGFFYG
jgi:hypothetical protein